MAGFDVVHTKSRNFARRCVDSGLAEFCLSLIAFGKCYLNAKKVSYPAYSDTTSNTTVMLPSGAWPPKVSCLAEVLLYFLLYVRVVVVGIFASGYVDTPEQS